KLACVVCTRLLSRRNRSPVEEFRLRRENRGLRGPFGGAHSAGRLLLRRRACTGNVAHDLLIGAGGTRVRIGLAFRGWAGSRDTAHARVDLSTHGTVLSRAGLLPRFRARDGVLLFLGFFETEYEPIARSATLGSRARSRIPIARVA